MNTGVVSTPPPPYNSDTLRWVAADVRYPPSQALAVAVPAALQEHLHERFPIAELAPAVSLTLSIGGAPPAPPQQVMLHRLLDRERLMSVTIGRDGVTLETTAYPQWENFRPILAEVIGHVQQDVAPDGITRVGLRYIDEIRVPDAPQTLGGWDGWVNDRLVEPFGIELDEELTQATVMLQYGTAPGYVTVFRASPLSGGRVVQEQGPLRLPFRTPEAPFFLLDTDSSWADPDRRVPPFDADTILEIFDRLHDRSHRLYEESIGPRLRTEVLSRTPKQLWEPQE
jgi:uncharacterized protein (TIGR04255 family)